MKAKSAYLERDRKWPYFRIFYEDGKTKSFTKRVEWETAELILAKIRNRIGLGTFEIEDFTTERTIAIRLGTAATEYITMRERQEQLENICKNTLNNDYYAMKLLVRELGKERIMCRIRKDDIENMKCELMTKKKTQHDRHYTAGGVTSYMRHISGFMTYCMERGYIKENPVKGLIETGKRKDQNREIRFLTNDEIVALRKYFEKQHEWQLDAFNFSLWTSARRAEVINLRKQDVFERENDVMVIRLFGKRNKERYVPVQKKAREMVLKRVAWLRDEKELEKRIEYEYKEDIKERYRQRWKEGYLFFEILRRDSLSKAFYKAKIECGLRESITFHSARHSYATDVLKQGADVLAVSKLLGHEDTRMTEHYAKVVEETLINTVKRIEEM